MTKRTNNMLHKIITMVLPMSNGKKENEKDKGSKSL
jgi:hypothetical protein